MQSLQMLADDYFSVLGLPEGLTFVYNRLDFPCHSLGDFMTVYAERLDDDSRVTETRCLKGGFKSVAEARNYIRSIGYGVGLNILGWEYFGYAVKQGGKVIYRD
jgi:hypothetical protein